MSGKPPIRICALILHEDKEAFVHRIMSLLTAMRDAQTMKEVENKKLEDKTEKKEEQAVEKAKPEAMPSVKKAEKTGPKGKLGLQYCLSLWLLPNYNGIYISIENQAFLTFTLFLTTINIP